MNWIQELLKSRSQQKKQLKIESKQSEEISDIIERMPMNFGRWVAITVIVFSILLILFGWIIKYPDTVSGQIKISSSKAPVKLVANISGNIHLFSHEIQDDIKQGDYIAVIQNPAKFNDVLKISRLIDLFNPTDQLTFQGISLFPETVSLGDLNLKYYTFLSSMKNKYDYENDNVFERQRISITDDIMWKETILSESREMLAITTQRLNISQKWLDKHKSLNKDDIITYEYEVDKSFNEYLAIKQEEQSLQKEIASIKMQIMESRNYLEQLDVEQKGKERELKLELLSSYQDLCDNIKAWEQRYVFKAPVDGKIEYLMFIVENQFVQSGEEVFSVVPKESNLVGQVLLPSSGAGKVKMNSKVSIKLNDYPYTEYGSIEGYVSSISLITQVQKTDQNIIDMYLITVELPDGLKTNYGEILDFKHSIGGVADIIVKERRLIERLFDNLKYNTK